MTSQNAQPYRYLIVIASIIIPALVAILYFMPKSSQIGEEVMFLPKLNAILNGTTSVLLILALIAIKNKKIELHRNLMFAAIILSVLFLLSYVTYHTLAESTHFGGEGTIKYIYYFILLSHILLAVIIVPLVLISFTRALSGKFDKHKKIARITLPLWLYVTITGVIVYLMISPYY